MYGGESWLLSEISEISFTAQSIINFWKCSRDYSEEYVLSVGYRILLNPYVKLVVIHIFIFAGFLTNLSIAEKSIGDGGLRKSPCVSKEQAQKMKF